MKFICVMVSVLLLSACGSGPIHPDVSTAASKDGVAKVWVAWVKDKGKKFDMNLNLTNLSDKKHMIIFLSDISCGRGGTNGVVRHTLFNSGERTINFAPGQSKAFNTVCVLPAKASGDYVVTVGKIFDNPSGDGRAA